MLLGLYTTDTADTLGRAQAAPAAEIPPSFSESYHAAFAETRAYANSDALWRARHEVVQAALDRLEDATGEVYANPEAASRGPNRDALEKSIRARFDSLKAERPDLDLAYPTDEEIQAGAVTKAQKVKGERDALAAKPGDFASGAGFIVGDIAGAMTDPLNIASMFAGAPPAAGILKTAAIEAGIAATSQAVIEAGTAPFKRQVDPQYGLAEAAGNVTAAAAGGAIIGGGLRAAGRALDWWRGRDRSELPREVQDALNVTERDQEVRAANPLGPSVAAEQAHAGALQKAAQDIEAGRPVDVQDIVREARAETPSAPAVPDRVFTSGGRAVDVEYWVVEAESLIASHDAQGGINPQFPAELQPRDRTRIASQAQIADMAANLQPERLGRSTDAATGAPIVGPDSVVESGNGRVTAIRWAYEQGGEAADRYRAWTVQQDPAAAQMRNPVLVAVRKTDVDRAAFAREANTATAARLSPTEQALADARHLDDAVMGRLSSGDVGAASNRSFARGFIDRLPASERGALVDADGALNQEGIKRVQGALMGRAYGDAAIIGRIVENADSDIRAIGGALLDVAGPWAKLRAAAARGDLAPGMDATADLLAAVRMVAEARGQGRAVAELANQGGLFGDDLPGNARLFLGALFRDADFSKPAGRQRVADFLRGYLDEATKNTSGDRLFGEPLSAEQILRGERMTGEAATDIGIPISPRPAEEVSGTPETQDALFQQVNRLLASREIDVPTEEVVDEAGKVVALKRSAMDLMDEADRAINDAATVAACAFGVAAE
ncbi:hypothetical protein [Azospirillum brasilense]|uniref:hypothetical protein n=1 Tax=Azospirillum brasilense TaxID=192 RepID=UPI000E69EA2C|nr:hypothetical protein [Azospirillum brasilense]NUB27727.1 hypothetical protein [Azospirillum brasilense]NUB35282.1 hypothetical protein [Azospirillum brasilense]RIV97405.1 hypothetical protein D2T81_28785 [Azospirillum brasilense]